MKLENKVLSPFYNKNSVIEPAKSNFQVLVDMILYVIDNNVRKPPYIAIVTKKQIWRSGKPWKDCEQAYIRAGLVKNMDIIEPSDRRQKEMQDIYGWDVLQKPWSALNRMTNHVMNALRKETLPSGTFEESHGELSDIRIWQCCGYILSDGPDQGKMDPRYKKGNVTCYVFQSADPERIPIINAWIALQPKWLQIQIERAKFEQSNSGSPQ